jgi:hypothetical protein
VYCQVGENRKVEGDLEKSLDDKQAQATNQVLFA